MAAKDLSLDTGEPNRAILTGAGGAADLKPLIRDIRISDQCFWTSTLDAQN